MNGIGNSAQIAKECQRKIDCINSNKKYVPSIRSASIIRDDILTLKSELKLVSFDALLGFVTPNTFCRKCGAKTPPNSDSRFCLNCGAEL